MSHPWQPFADYIQKNLSTDPAKPIEADTPLLSSGLIDSFTLAQLVVYVEQAYGIKIAAAFRTEEHFRFHHADRGARRAPRGTAMIA